MHGFRDRDRASVKAKGGLGFIYTAENLRSLKQRFTMYKLHNYIFFSGIVFFFI